MYHLIVRKEENNKCSYLPCEFARHLWLSRAGISYVAVWHVRCGRPFDMSVDDNVCKKKLVGVARRSVTTGCLNMLEHMKREK